MEAGRAYFWRPPSAKKLQALGLTLADVDVPVIELWTGQQQAFDCFRANSTQWRMGMNGPCALDYTPCYQWCSDHGITGKDRAHIMDNIRWLEAGALAGMQDARENAQ